MSFSYGTSKDAPQVLKLLEGESYKGDLRIIFTRRDDPVESLLKENDGSVTGVVRDSEDRIIATISLIPRQMYIGGELKSVAYITGYKKDQSYKKIINWRKVFLKISEIGYFDACFCCFVGDNDMIIKMLSKRRAKLPHAIPICMLEAFIYNPALKVKDPHPELQFKQGTEDSVSGITGFISAQGKGRDLFHKLDSVDDIKGLKAEDFYCLIRDGKPVAAAAIWNRQDVKQYYLKECRGKMKLLRCLNPLLSLLGFIRLPADNTKVNLAYISFAEAENDDPGLMTSLLCRILKEAKKDYDAVVISAVPTSKKFTVLKKIRGIRITHYIAQLDMSSINNIPPAAIDGENTDLECALL